MTMFYRADMHEHPPLLTSTNNATYWVVVLYTGLQNKMHVFSWTHKIHNIIYALQQHSRCAYMHI